MGVVIEPKTRGDIAFHELAMSGWNFSHYALFSQYLPAGTISDMSTRKGYHYCRIHLGKKCGNSKHSYQYTIVMKKPIQ